MPSADKPGALADWIPVNIVLGDRTYRIRIEPGREELVRKTLKLVNDKVVEFKTQFAGKDMQDYISMVLIWFATEQNRAGQGMIQEQELADRLEALDQLLNAALNEDAAGEGK